MGEVSPELLVTLAAHACAILIGAITLAWRVGRTEAGLSLRFEHLSQQLNGLQRTNERLAVIEAQLAHQVAGHEDISRRVRELEGDVAGVAARAGVSIRTTSGAA